MKYTTRENIDMCPYFFLAKLDWNDQATDATEVRNDHNSRVLFEFSKCSPNSDQSPANVAFKKPLNSTFVLDVVKSLSTNPL